MKRQKQEGQGEGDAFVVDWWDEFYNVHDTKARDETYRLQDFDVFLKEYLKASKYMLVAKLEMGNFFPLIASVEDLHRHSVSIPDWFAEYQEYVEMLK